MRRHFVHITDAHLDDGSAQSGNVDLKMPVPGIRNPTRTEAKAKTLDRVTEFLVQRGVATIEAVIVSGDAADRGNAKGHAALLTLILEKFEPFGVGRHRIVAVPGNHDVEKGSLPDTERRVRANM